MVWTWDASALTFDSILFTIDGFVTGGGGGGGGGGGSGGGTTGAQYVNPQFVFGPGIAWITPLQDAFGNAIANPSPVLVAQMQDVSLDLSAEMKELYGSNSFAIAIGRGKQKFSVKLKNAHVHGLLWNSLFFGQPANLTAGIYDTVYDTAGEAVPATPYQITPTPPNSGTWGYNLGVRDANNLPLQRVAASPATRQYTVAAGVYTFAAADTGITYYIDYNYTATSTTAKKLSIANLPMGYAPVFQFDLRIPYLGNVFNCTLYQCISTSLSLATKLDDFALPEFQFGAFAPGASALGELSWYQ